jgi:diaminopimelate epimerase
MLHSGHRVIEDEYPGFCHRTANGVRFGQLRFCVMLANGSVLLILDEILSQLNPYLRDDVLARAICRSLRAVRVTGISFVRATTERVRMAYFQRNGTRSQLCGNALRCTALYASERGFLTDEGFIGTDDGEKWVSISGGRVTVALGGGRGFRTVGEQRYFVFTGLPHVVIPVAELETVDVREQGAVLRFDERLCTRVGHPGFHVDFMRREGQDEIGIRTYEEGVDDETPACGTGAAASAFVAARLWEMCYPVRVRTRAGAIVVGENEHGLLIGGGIAHLFSNIGPRSGLDV